MNQHDILDILKKIIMPYLENPIDIEMESDLSKDLAINSVDFVNIIIEIEDTFNHSIEEKKMFNMRSVNDLVKYIMEFNVE